MAPLITYVIHFNHKKFTNVFNIILIVYIYIYFQTRQFRWKLDTCSMLSCDFPEQFSFVTSCLYVQKLAVLYAAKL